MCNSGLSVLTGYFAIKPLSIHDLDKIKVNKSNMSPGSRQNVFNFSGAANDKHIALPRSGFASNSCANGGSLRFGVSNAIISRGANCTATLCIIKPEYHVLKRPCRDGPEWRAHAAISYWRVYYKYDDMSVVR